MVLFNAREVLLIRHAEKTGIPGDSGLSDVGLARAMALATILPERFGPPDIIIACTSVPSSTRPFDTVRLLAAKLGLPIRDDWNTDDFDELARTIRSHPAYADKRVLVCWRHKTLPALARSLGIRAPPVWPETLYDCLWRLRPTPDGVKLFASRQGIEGL